MQMYEWLSQELDDIKTNKFHLVGNTHSHEDQQISPELLLVLPPSYQAFLTKYQGIRLFRLNFGFEIYGIVVFGIPKNVVMKETDEKCLYIGYSDESGYAYFKQSSLSSGHEASIYEWDEYDEEPALVDSAQNFEDWLMRTYDQIRRRYDEIKWQNIIQGPAPFSPNELAIIEARNLFKWHVVGINEQNEIQVSVRNESDRVLPYLTFGVKKKDGTLFGGIWLKVSQVEPGEEKVIEQDVYKDLLDPENVELFLRSDPQPEDRTYYWEFK